MPVTQHTATSRVKQTVLLSLLALTFLLTQSVSAQPSKPATADIVPSFDTAFVTRAEAVMFLLQARIPTIPNLVTKGEFPDVPQGVWYERYIAVGERLGIIQANPTTHRMRPDDPVTRAEFMTM